MEVIRVPEGVLPSLGKRELPAPWPLRAMVGPGIILAGLSIGSGEFVLWPRLTAQWGFAVFWAAWIGVDRVLAQICRALGRLDQAVDHFQSAMDFCQRSGFPSQKARVSLYYAGTLLERRGAGDLEHARTLIEEAVALADNLGMGPLLGQLTSLQHEVPASRAAASNPGGLTQREVEVIRLVAQGKTDREIAEELIIGVRTVTTHVGNILNKTGAANRAEAASFATRHGLD